MFSILSRQRSRGNPAIAETTSSMTGDNDRTTCALREEGPSSAGGGGVYGDGGGNSSSVSVGLSEAFRLRGSSSSGMLLPRPPPPSTDSLDYLFGAAGATATPVVETEMVEEVGGMVEKGVGVEVGVETVSSIIPKTFPNTVESTIYIGGGGNGGGFGGGGGDIANSGGGGSGGVIGSGGHGDGVFGGADDIVDSSSDDGGGGGDGGAHDARGRPKPPTSTPFTLPASPLPLQPLRRKPEPMRRANVVLSDMAPSFSGDRDIDQARVATLVLDSLAACLGDEGGRLRGAPGVGKGGGGGGDQDGGGGGVSGSDVEVGVGEDGGGVGGWDGGVGCADGVSAGGDRGGVSVGGGGGDVVGGGGGIDRGSGDSVIGSGGGGGGGCRSGGERWGGGGLLARGGTFLGKFFAGRDEGEVKREAERLFERVKVVKPPASRSSSGEMYLLATGFLSGARTGKKEAEK